MVGESSVTASLSFCGLEETVQGFEEAVGLARLGPSNNAVEVLANHSVHIFHRFYLEAHDVGAPLGKHGGDDVDLFALEDFTQLFLVEPGARRSLGRDVGNQASKSARWLSGRSCRFFSSVQRKPLRSGSVFGSSRRVRSTAVEA